MMDLVLGHDLIFLYLLLIPNDICICDLNVLFDYYISEHNHTLSLISDQLWYLTAFFSACKSTPKVRKFATN